MTLKTEPIWEHIIKIDTWETGSEDVDKSNLAQVSDE
jgi:hypothetical protein